MLTRDEQEAVETLRREVRDREPSALTGYTITLRHEDAATLLNLIEKLQETQPKKTP